MDTKNCTESSSNGKIRPESPAILTSLQAAGMLAVGALMAGRIMDTV